MLSRDEKNLKRLKIKNKKITIQKRNKNGTGNGMECAQLGREQERERPIGKLDNVNHQEEKKKIYIYRNFFSILMPDMIPSESRSPFPFLRSGH